VLVENEENEHEAIVKTTVSWNLRFEAIGGQVGSRYGQHEYLIAEYVENESFADEMKAQAIAERQ